MYCTVVNDAKSVPTPTVNCLIHVQNRGDMRGASKAVIGTTGKGLRGEGIALKLNNKSGYTGSITYKVHMKDKGWSKSWSKDWQFSGTRMQGRRIEAMRVNLTGQLAQHYDVWYRVHVQNYGWMGWTKDGKGAGTTGKGLRLEAYQIVILPKGSAAPGKTAKSFVGKWEDGAPTNGAPPTRWHDGNFGADGSHFVAV